MLNPSIAPCVLTRKVARELRFVVKNSLHYQQETGELFSCVLRLVTLRNLKIVKLLNPSIAPCVLTRKVARELRFVVKNSLHYQQETGELFFCVLRLVALRNLKKSLNC